MNRRPGYHRDGGFTLVELLVAVVIEALVVGALGGAFIGILNGTKTVNANLSRSGDARIAAAYVIGDASNSSGPEVSLTSSTCTDPSPPAGTPTLVVQFGWSSTSSTGAKTTNVIDYFLVSNTLYRKVCQGGTFVTDRAVASSVASVTAVCSPTANCSGSPTSITVTVTETPDSTGSYQYGLTGAFRKLIGDGQPVVQPPIFLLGAGNCTAGASGLDIAGGSALRVYGTADINSADIPGASGCTAMQIGTDAFNYMAGATQIYSPPSGGSGTCGASGSSTCPPITNYSPALTDPYANLPALAGVPAGACSGSNPSPVGNAYPPGVYPQALNVPATATFSGTYIFCAGLSFTNGARVTGTNVLFYFKGGSLTEGGDSQVALAASNTGAYRGLVVWQPASDTTAITISNGGQFALTGAIYAPGAQVVFTGGSVTTTVTSIVAQTISLSRGANVSIGSASSPGLSFSLPGTLVTSWPVSTAYSSPAFTGAGGDGNYTWSATNLPAGLTMNASTGVITGTTPAAATSSTVTVTLSDALGDDVATQTFTFKVNAKPAVTSLVASSVTKGSSNVSITVNGTGFLSGATVAFNVVAGDTGTQGSVTVGSVTFGSATKLTVVISVASPNSARGTYHAVVTNPDTGTSATGAGNVLTVT